MTIKISHWVMFMGVIVSVWLTVSLPQYWRLPAAPRPHASHQAQFHGLGHSVSVAIAEAR
jgi:hypothetical protein